MLPIQKEPRRVTIGRVDQGYVWVDDYQAKAVLWDVVHGIPGDYALKEGDEAIFIPPGLEVYATLPTGEKYKFHGHARHDTETRLGSFLSPSVDLTVPNPFEALLAPEGYPPPHIPKDLRQCPEMFLKGEEVVVLELVEGDYFVVQVTAAASVHLHGGDTRIPALVKPEKWLPPSACLYGVSKAEGDRVRVYVMDVALPDGKWMRWDDIERMSSDLRVGLLPKLARANWHPRSLWAKDLNVYRPLVKKLSEQISEVENGLSRGVLVRPTTEETGRYGRVIAACENENWLIERYR